MVDRAVKARELLERGAYLEAADCFLQVGEYASAARAFTCAKDYRRAAASFERAQLPLDAARLLMLLREWGKAAELYTLAGDHSRAELARQQLAPPPAPPPPPVAPAAARAAQAAPAAPAPAAVVWPEGAIWSALRSGDPARAAELYLKPGAPSGWQLLEETRSAPVGRALAEAFVLARDFALAGETFRRLKDDNRAAQCLSQAGLHEEAADLFMRAGQKLLAAQHLEKARAWDQAASVYQEAGRPLEAARCYEKNDDPVKAAALYLKDRKPDLALPLLQSIPPSHKSFAACRLLAGKILFQKGERAVALALLAPLLEGEPKSDEGLETFYQTAVLLEQGGEPERAREAYARLQQIRFDYRDVRVRLETLGRATVPPPPVTTVILPLEPSLDLAPLRNCSLFDRLDMDDLRRLASIGRETAVAAGTVFVEANQHTDGLSVVLSGGLTITPDPSKRDLAVGFLAPGDYVGLGSLIQGPPQANALVAQNGTRLLRWSAADIETALQTQPELGVKFYRSVAEHVARKFAAETGRPQR